MILVKLTQECLEFEGHASGGTKRQNIQTCSAVSVLVHSLAAWFRKNGHVVKRKRWRNYWRFTRIPGDRCIEFVEHAVADIARDYPKCVKVIYA